MQTLSFNVLVLTSVWKKVWMIHPSIHFLYSLNPSQGCRRPDQSITGPHKDKHNKQPYAPTVIRRVCLELAINVTCMFLDDGRSQSIWREHAQGKYANSTQKGPSRDSNQEASCCKDSTNHYNTVSPMLGIKHSLICSSKVLKSSWNVFICQLI